MKVSTSVRTIHRLSQKQANFLKEKLQNFEKLEANKIEKCDLNTSLNFLQCSSKFDKIERRGDPRQSDAKTFQKNWSTYFLITNHLIFSAVRYFVVEGWTEAILANVNTIYQKHIKQQAKPFRIFFFIFFFIYFCYLLLLLTV